MIKNKYKDDYSWFTRLTDKGRVVDDICYTGDYYILPFNMERKKKTNLVNIGFSVLLLGILTAAGMVNQESSRTFWIVYPYIFIFLPLGYMILGAVSYLSVPLRMQKAHYETGLARINHSLKGTMALSAVCVILTIVYIILHFGSVSLGREFAYISFHCLFLSVAFLYDRYYNRTYGGVTIEKALTE